MVSEPPGRLAPPVALVALEGLSVRSGVPRLSRCLESSVRSCPHGLWGPPAGLGLARWARKLPPRPGAPQRPKLWVASQRVSHNDACGGQKVPHVLIVQKMAVWAEEDAVSDTICLGEARSLDQICAGNARDDVGGLHWPLAAQRARAGLPITIQQRASKS